MNLPNRICKFVIGGALAAISVSVAAYNNAGQIVEAEVVSAQPIYTVVQVNNPQQQCWQEAVSVPSQQGYKTRTPEILGAIVGAGVGRLFGSGRGQDVATVAGAVLGGSIGRDQNNKRSSTNSTVRYEQRCKTVDNYRSEERLQGYDVTYQYNGDLYTTRTQSDPGRTITLNVSVVPVES